MVMVEPAFLALTSTPSIGPSSADVTRPPSAAALCAAAGATSFATRRTRAKTAAAKTRFMTSLPSRKFILFRCSAQHGAHFTLYRWSIQSGYEARMRRVAPVQSGDENAIAMDTSLCLR
jgi:hypothetical protein